MRNLIKNTALPAVLDAHAMDLAGVDLILDQVPPAVSRGQLLRRDGIEQRPDGWWQWRWQITEMSPPLVSARNFRRALLAAGMLDYVEATLYAWTRPALVDWQCAHPITAGGDQYEALKKALGWDDARLNELMHRAAAL